LTKIFLNKKLRNFTIEPLLNDDSEESIHLNESSERTDSLKWLGCPIVRELAVLSHSCQLDSTAISQRCQAQDVSAALHHPRQSRRVE